MRGEDGTTYYAAGAWRDDRGAELAEPVALVVARPNLSDVVDAEGELETTGRSIRPAQTSSLDAGAGAPPEGLPGAGAIAPADAGSGRDDAP